MRSYLLILAALVIIISCKKSPSSSITDFEASEYIVNHSKNFIKPIDNPFVRLRSMEFDESKINQELDKSIVTIDPHVDGAFIWQDNQTIQFIPDDRLEYDKKYSISLHLDKIFNTAAIEDPVYVFDVHTDQMYFKVDLDKLEYVSSDKLYQYIRVETNFLLQKDNCSDVISVLHGGHSLRDMELTYNGNENYIIKAGPISKKDKKSKLKVDWNVKDLNAKIKSSIIREIPSINDFSVMDLRMSDADNLHFQIVFSNSLAKQKYDGLVTVEGYTGTYQYKAVSNILHVYLDKKIFGNHKVNVNSKIKNNADGGLDESYREDLLFAHTLPAIRSTAEGNIVPNSDQVVFPFEAINLDTIEVEVFQIFKNNVYESLRYYELDNAQASEYLGRVIHNEKIPLKRISHKSNADEWVRYAIDIKQLTDIQSGAIYQIRLGFMKSYVNYTCEVESENVIDRKSAFDFKKFYNRHNYNNRTNPCFNEYYDNDKFIYRNILASNLGMIVKKGKSNTLNVVTTDIRNASALSNTKVEIYDAQKQLLLEMQSDKNGVINCQLDRDPNFIIAHTGADYAYLSLRDNKVNALSEFDVSGVETQDGIQGYLYGERGVWRPGDTLHLSFMLIDNQNTIADSQPVSFAIKDSKGNTKYSKVTTDNTEGIFVFQVPTSSGDPTGLWKADIEVGNFKYSQRLKVETIKPNRLKVDLQFKDEEIDVTEKETFLLKSEWLHGAPASGLKADVDIKYNNRATTFAGYSDYEFTDPSRKLAGDMSSIFSGNLDAMGEQKVAINFGKDFKPPGLVDAQLRTRVYEKSGNFSEDYTAVNINPYSSYVGVSIPTTSWGGKVLNVEENEAIKFIAIDKNGKPAQNRKLSIGVYEARWNWWYNRSDNNLYRFNSTNHLGAIDKNDLVTDASGRVSYVPSLQGHDSYLVRVCDTESGHCSGTIFYSSSYNYNKKPEGEIAKLDIVTDKATYNLGESIELSIPSNEQSKIYVSVEDNDKVVSSFWLNGKKETTQVSISVTDDMTPNIYLHVSLLQGTEKNNDLPIRLYGISSVSVVDPNSVLKPVIDIADEIRPNRNAEVTISESQDREMAYTLALVDEGLLDITNFKTPDPWASFFAKQSLGVKTWDVFDQVLNRHGGAIESIISIGGDAANLEAQQNAQANRFKPVVRFMGPFKLAPGENRSHSVDIPNYVGSLRVMVIAKSGSSFGHKAKNVTVKDPLMLMATLPRVMAPNESLSLPVNVFAYDDKIKKANLNLNVSSNLKVVGDDTGSLSFTSQGDKLYNFDMKVMEQTGIAEVKVNSYSSGFKAYENLEIVIRNPSPKISDVYTEVIKEGQNFTFDFSTIGTVGSNEAYVELSNFPDYNLAGRLEYLMRYPYGCVEQTTSSVFPQIYLDDLMELSVAEKSKVKKNITAGIKRLQSFQNSNGGLSYWSGRNSISDWGTSYAGHFIIEAKKKGYYVSNAFFIAWKKYQKEASRKYRYQKDNYYQVQQAYRLYTLALVGDAQLSAMNSLRTEKYLDKVTRYLLSASYALINQSDIAADLIKGLDYNIKSYRSLAYTYGSDLRDRSIILLSLMHQGDDSNAYRLATQIAGELSKKSWYSTQTTAFALMSLAEFIDGQKQDELNYTLNHNNDMKLTQTSTTVMDVYQLDVTKKKTHKLSVANNSSAPMYARVVNSGKPLPEPQPSYKKGVDLRIKYVDEDGKSVDPNKLKLGTDFVAVVTVRNISSTGMDYEEMALNHTLPSGWEIQNLRTGGIKVKGNSSFEYQDIRDDRAYTFFDLKAGKSKTFRMPMTAAYAGRFFMPNVHCGAMYDEDIAASVTGSWVEVIR